MGQIKLINLCIKSLAIMDSKLKGLILILPLQKEVSAVIAHIILAN